MAADLTQYPLRLTVEYPDRLDRLTTFFRLIWAIPIVIVIVLLIGSNATGGDPGFLVGIVSASGLIFFAPAVMILFREKYPRWWFEWNLEMLRFSARITAYLWLLTDRYPSTDEAQSIHLEMDYPDVPRDLNRWLPLVKWLLAIPHYIVLYLLGILALFALVVAWFAILFTGRYPPALFDFVVGVVRWSYRVQAYAFMLVTDRYPPFRLLD